VLFRHGTVIRWLYEFSPMTLTGPVIKTFKQSRTVVVMEVHGYRHALLVTSHLKRVGLPIEGSLETYGPLLLLFYELSSLE